MFVILSGIISILLSSLLLLGSLFIVRPIWEDVKQHNFEFYEITKKALKFVKEDLHNSDGSIKELSDKELEQIKKKEQWFNKFFTEGYTQTAISFSMSNSLEQSLDQSRISKDFLKWYGKNYKI